MRVTIIILTAGRTVLISLILLFEEFLVESRLNHRLQKLLLVRHLLQDISITVNYHLNF